MIGALPSPAGHDPAGDRPAMRWIGCGRGDSALLTLPVRIGGVDASAVLDSGATQTVIDAGFARRHGLRGVQERRVTALTAEVPAGITGPLEIGVGDALALTTSALVLDLTSIARAARMPIDMVLGHEIFLRGVIDIDPDREALRFLDDESEGSQHWLPVLQARDGHFCTAIALADGGRTDAIVDLGSLAPLYISPELAAAKSLFAGGRYGSSASVGVEGITVSRLGRLRSMRLGDATLHDIPFAVPPLWRFAAPVVLGLPLLMRFRCRLDFGRSRMSMLPASGSSRPFACDRSGLSVIHAGDRLEVVHVASNSPAASAGLNAGDSIIAINGVAIDASGSQKHSNLGKAPAGTRYLLSVPGKGEQQLVLREYY